MFCFPSLSNIVFPSVGFDLCIPQVCSHFNVVVQICDTLMINPRNIFVYKIYSKADYCLLIILVYTSRTPQNASRLREEDKIPTLFRQSYLRQSQVFLVIPNFRAQFHKYCLHRAVKHCLLCLVMFAHKKYHLI